MKFHQDTGSFLKAMAAFWKRMQFSNENLALVSQDT